MATLKQAKSSEEMKKLGVAATREAYNTLAGDYNRIIDRDVLLCPTCGDWMKAETSFYFDKKYATNRYPVCKQCLMAMVEQRKNKKDNSESNETKESVQKVLQMMDRVYDDGFYEECIKGATDGMKEKNRTSPFATYITATASLPQWKGKTWKDSDFGSSETSADEEETRIVQKTIKAAKRRFGNGFSNEDYMYLENTYQDWCTRTQVDSLSQETYVKQICMQLLDIDKDRKDGKDVSKKLDALDKLMNSANLQPKQNVSNAATDSLTFSQLIAKWEEHDPIPEPEEDLSDVSGIGKNIRVWMAGWLGHALGLNTPQTKEYLEEVEKYTVTKPEHKEEEKKSSTYNKLFGSEG